MDNSASLSTATLTLDVLESLSNTVANALLKFKSFNPFTLEKAGAGNAKDMLPSWFVAATCNNVDKENFIAPVEFFFQSTEKGSGA